MTNFTPGGTAADLLRRIEQLETRLQNVNQRFGFAEILNEFPDIAEILFRGRDIRKTDLSREDIAYIDFRGSDLSGCNFDGARINGARFEMAKLSRDSLRRAQDWSSYKASWKPEPTDCNGHPMDAVHFVRRPGERFGLSPHLPELVMLNFAMLGPSSQLLPEEADAISRGQLAIALRPVTNAEFSATINMDQVGDETRSPRGPYTVQPYLSSINLDPERFGLSAQSSARLPSRQLMSSLALQCQPTSNLSPEATDISADDLGVGRSGPEFVTLEDGADPKIGVISRQPGSPSGLDVTAEIGDRFAHLRPIFVLGT
jgi:hypothetical protein